MKNINVNDVMRSQLTIERVRVPPNGMRQKSRRTCLEEVVVANKAKYLYHILWVSSFWEGLVELHDNFFSWPPASETGCSLRVSLLICIIFIDAIQ